MEQLAKKIVEAIHDELNERRGFDFCALDEDIYEELCAAQIDVVLKCLKDYPHDH